MNALYELLFCPVHGLLRYWPILVPGIASASVIIRRAAYRLKSYIGGAKNQSSGS